MESETKKKPPEPRRDGTMRTLIEGKKYKLTIYTGRTATGKRVYFNQVFRGTSSQAKARLRQLATDIDNGITPTRVLPEPVAEPEPVLLGDVLDRWLRHKSSAGKTRQRTIDGYEWLFDHYARTALGAKPIAEVNESDIQELYNELAERGIGARTVRHLHAALRPALDRAVRWKLIAENPSAHVELPSRSRNGPRRFLTLEQTRAFLAAAEPDKWHAAFLLAVKTALRPGELLALRWDDLDFNNRSISISRSLYWPVGGGFEFTLPKTANSERAVPVSDEVLESLRQHRREQLEQRLAAARYSDLDLIFATETGTPLSWKNLTRRHLKPLVKAAGIPKEGISMYTLRHTGISLMLWAGVDVVTVARITGTSVAMIDATYGHILQALQRTAIDRVTALLATATG